MFVRIILCTIALWTPATAQKDLLCTNAGPIADSLIRALPRTDSTYATLGILFTNRIFLKQSSDGRSDADSALYYLRTALATTPSPQLAAYECIARALRASKDGWWPKINGATKTRATQAFDDCDSLARQYPNDLRVQFLTANLLQEGDRLDQKKYYWQRAWDILAHLQTCALSQPEFFTDEISANILLNQGKLVRKLRLYEKNSDAEAVKLWERTIREYPNTNAATNARLQLNS